MSDLDNELETPDEGQEVLAEGDLGTGHLYAKYLDQMNREEYYNSLKFAVGYRELQTMWKTSESDKDQENDVPNRRTCERPFSASGQMLFDAAQRKQFMNLPLHGFDTGSESSSPRLLQVPPFRTRRWASSAGASPLGTPSPVTSEAPSPITSSPSTSVTSSPRLGGSQRGHVASILTSESDIDSCRYESEESLQDCVQEPPKNDGKLQSSLMEAIRRIIGQLTGRRRSHSSPRLHSEHQIAEMEAELESYRKLSDSKRRAADLLKHQLMEVLYEKVVSEVEERHRRRQLENEMMGLEFELHLLRSTTEESIRTLTRQLERVITEKQALQRQVSYRTPDDFIPEYNHQFSCCKINDLSADSTLRRASH